MNSYASVLVLLAGVFYAQAFTNYYSRYNYQPFGESETALSIKKPAAAAASAAASATARSESKKRYPGGTTDNEGDAFKHTLWSMLMTLSIGSSNAKRFGDAHERSFANKLGSRLMDLHNNEQGRLLASRVSLSKSPASVIRQAIREGKLLLQPVQALKNTDAKAYDQQYKSNVGGGKTDTVTKVVNTVSNGAKKVINFFRG